MYYIKKHKDGFKLKVAFYTLGCKVNQYDTQMMMEKLSSAGFDICTFEDNADIYIINTCTVTQISDKKSRNTISKARRMNPDAIIVVCGCFSQVSPGDAAAIDGVDIVIGTRNRADIVFYINQFLKEGGQLIDVQNGADIQSENITSFSEKTRAIIKIEDGCRNFCSYCLIPFARGKIISKPIDQIVSESVALVKSGYKEIVLTGIHLSSYGSDIGGVDLSDAIDAVSSVAGVERIRLGSLEPTIVTPEFVARIKNNDKVCPAFHLSLQSGCNKTLKAMNRKYTAGQYANAVSLLRENISDSAFTTDVIVGFPGESEDDFEQSLDFVDKIAFSKVHIFPYSKRKGTKAATMPYQISKQVKKERETRLQEVELKNRIVFMKSFLNKTVSVLVERSVDGVCNGFTKNYIPVFFDGQEELCNRIVSVKITRFDENSLFGIIE